MFGGFSLGLLGWGLGYLLAVDLVFLYDDLGG